jgi:hypothetical protein
MTTLDKDAVLDVLDETLDAFESFMDKTDWGKSFLDASTIRKANEVPGKALRVLKVEGRR